MFPFYQNQYEELHCFDTDGINFPLHLHEPVELFYSVNGTAQIQTNNESFLLPSGGFAVIFPNVLHAYQTPPDNTSRFILAISPLSLSGNFTNILLKQHPKIPVLQANQVHEDVIYAMHALHKRNDSPINPAADQAFIQLILSRILPELQLEKNTDVQRTDLISRIILYLSENFTRPISLEDLSSSFGVSKYYLSRVFSKQLMTSFNQYVNSLRVNLAQNLLRSTKESILDVCYECGFDSQRTFNRVFKEQCGVTPSEYRNNIF